MKTIQLVIPRSLLRGDSFLWGDLASARLPLDFLARMAGITFSSSQTDDGAPPANEYRLVCPIDRRHQSRAGVMWASKYF
jgi:hypothetical protein